MFETEINQLIADDPQIAAEKTEFAEKYAQLTEFERKAYNMARKIRLEALDAVLASCDIAAKTIETDRGGDSLNFVILRVLQPQVAEAYIEGSLAGVKLVRGLIEARIQILKTVEDGVVK